MIFLHIYSPEKLIGAAEFGSVKERNLAVSSAAYEQVKMLANEHYGISELTKNKTQRGKPYFENSTICFSVSHCNKAIAIALSDSSVGVDAETMREFKPYALKRLFSENELSYLSADPTCRAIELWTLREAVCKAHGDGFSDWFYHSDLVSDSGALKASCIRDNSEYHLSTFHYDGFIVSVASAKKDNIKALQCL